MILSKISRNDEGLSDSAVGSKNQGYAVLYLWILVSLISILLAVLKAGSVAPLDLFIWRPILIFGVLLSMWLWLKLWLKLEAFLAWEKVKGGFFWAVLTALVFGLIDWWQSGSGLLPLSLKEMGYYFLTLGFWPLSAGPESLLRGFVLGLAVFFVVREYKQTGQDIKSLVGGAGLWFFGSLIVLTPSLMILLALWLNKVNAWWLSGAEIVKEFSRLNINTYWSDGQIIRWFTGFGGQLPTTMALFTASWIFILSFVLLVWINYWPRKPWSVFSHLKMKTWLFLIIAPLTGLSFGWMRLPASSLDLASWLVLIIVCFSLFKLLLGCWSQGAKTDFLEPWLIYFVLSGSALLGWTVFLPMVATLGLYWVSRKSWFDEHAISREVCLCLAWPFIAGSALAFMRRGDVFTPGMNLGLVVFWLLASMIMVLPWLLKRYGYWQVVLAVWLLAGLGATLWLKTVAALAVVAFLALISQILRKKWSRFDIFWPYLIVASFFVIFILIFLIPRLAQSKLTPL